MSDENGSREEVLLVAEVVAAGSAGRDRIVKPGIFAEAGISSFWRVELEGPGAPLVIVHPLGGGAHREVVTVRAGERLTVDLPHRVEIRSAELVGPRRKG